MAVWSEIGITKLVDIRFDSEYYQPSNIEMANRLEKVQPSLIEDFAEVLDGIHGSPEWVEEDGVTYLSAKCVKNNYFVLTAAGQISPEQDMANKRTRAQVGDVLITTVGTIGNAAVVEYDILPANMDRHLGIIRIHDSSVNPYYVATFLNSSFGRFQSVRESTGNVQLNLYIAKLNKMKVPLGTAFNTIGELSKRAYDIRRNSELFYAEAEALLLSALHLDKLDFSRQLTYERSFNDVKVSGRFDAQYFHPEKAHAQAQLETMPGNPIGSYFESVFDLVDPLKQSDEEAVYNYDLTDALRYFLTDDVEAVGFDQLGSAKKQFQRGDIVVSRLRSYLKEIALVETPPGLRCVGSSEFYVLRRREREVTAELLLVYLRSEPVQRILKWCQDGSQHPRFKEGEILTLNLPNRLLSVQAEITQLVRQGIEAYQNANRLLDEAKQQVEHLIMSSA